MEVAWGEKREDLFYEAFQVCRHLSPFIFTDEEARKATLGWLADTAAEARAIDISTATGDHSNETAVALRRRRMVAVCCAAADELDAFVRGPVARSVPTNGEEQPEEAGLVAFEADAAGLALANAFGLDGASAGTITPMVAVRTIGYALHNLPSLVRSPEEFNPAWFAGGDAADIRRAVAPDATWAAAFARTTEAIDALAGVGQEGGGGGGDNGGGP